MQHPQCPVPRAAGDNCPDHPAACCPAGRLQLLKLPTHQPWPDGSPHVPHPLHWALPRDVSAGRRWVTCSSDITGSGQCPLSHTWSQLEADFKSKLLLDKSKRDESATTREKFIPCMGGEQCLVSFSNLNASLDVRRMHPLIGECGTALFLFQARLLQK